MLMMTYSRIAKEIRGSSAREGDPWIISEPPWLICTTRESMTQILLNFVVTKCYVKRCGSYLDYCLNTGHYLYIETSFPRQPGDKARVIFKVFRVNCLQFWYHMWGADIGQLKVYHTTFQPSSVVPHLAWHLQGNQGDAWKLAQVPFDADFVEVKLNFLYSLLFGK